MGKIISQNRSIIPACDVDKVRYEEIIKETCDIPQIGAYKISAVLAITEGMESLVEIAKKYTNKPLIYDHQKAGTDIPATGKSFTSELKKIGINALIIFPLSGPATQAEWIRSAQEVELPIIVGGYMTHERFVVSDGGYIDDNAAEKIYTNAAFQNITDYVVPGNKPAIIKKIKNILTENNIDPIFYAPGFIAQGGQISEAAKEAGLRWHAIVGRAIYESQDIQKVVDRLIQHL